MEKLIKFLKFLRFFFKSVFQKKYIMTFRFARHTNDLERIQSFYTSVLGLELLGGFELEFHI